MVDVVGVEEKRFCFQLMADLLIDSPCTRFFNSIKEELHPIVQLIKAPSGRQFFFNSVERREEQLL